MNKAYRVVWSKARGAMMVVNEATGSIRKKSVKTAVVAAMAMMAAGGAVADTQYDVIDQTKTFAKITGGFKNFTAGVTVDQAQISNNHLTVTNYGYGSIWRGWKAKGLIIKDTVVKNNTFVNTSKYIGSSDVNAENSALLGGFIFIKDGSTTFENTVFSNNKLIGQNGALVAGAAVYADAVKNETDGSLASAVTFKVTKDMTYSGNDVESSNPDEYFGLYGSVSTAAGGFLFLDRQSFATFDIGADATLTIGEKGAEDKTGNLDTIASSIITSGDKEDVSGFTKTGTGTLVINSSLDKFYGSISVEEGKLSITSDWNVMNTVTVGENATLEVESISIGSSPTAITWNGMELKEGVPVVDREDSKKTHTLIVTKGTIELNGGTLATGIGQVFSDGESNATLNSSSVTLKNGFTLTSGTLALTDEGSYSMTLFDNVQNTLNENMRLVFENATLKTTADEQTTDTTLSRDATFVNGGVTHEAVFTVAESKKLTLQSAAEASNFATLVIKGTVQAENETTLNIEELKGTGKLLVGQVGGTGASSKVNKLLNAFTGTIFVDPAYNHHAELGISEVENGQLKASIIAGNGSLVTIGTDVATAESAMTNVDLPEGTNAVVYLAQSLDLTNGRLTVDPTATESTVGTQGQATVAANGALVVDQAGVGEKAVTGTVNLANSSTLAIVNANAGSFELADTVNASESQNVVTDNPFIQATLSGTTVNGSVSAENGLGALASTGIQAMTRRADTILAQSIADRTSLDQELAAGANLWVDVTGEHNEADSFDNGGSFEADMGYGAFGADFALTETVRAGAAIQYGKGSLRSSVSNIKNDIQNYGISAYVSKSWGDAKIVGELAYIQSENEITSSQTALNQDVDAKIYSAGVRAQYRLTAGNFQFVPSIGVRVSQLETDAMQVGSVRVDDQDQTLVQVPIVLRINGFEQNVNGWSLAPSFKVAYVPTFGDKEISVLGYDQDVIDGNTVLADFGLRATNGNLMLNANMIMGTGEYGSSSIGGKVGLKYVF